MTFPWTCHKNCFSCLSTCLEHRVPTFRIRSFELGCSAPLTLESKKVWLQKARSLFEFVEIAVQGYWYLLLARISLMEGFDDLGRNPLQVLGHRLFQIRVKAFFTISLTFWSGLCSVCSTSLAFFPLGFSPIKSPASRALTGMVAARVILTGLKTQISSPPTLRTNVETTATIKCAEVIKIRIRALFWHNWSAADLEPSSCGHRAESKHKSKIKNKTIPNSWSKTHV